jgi:gamma-glutamylcyclotransferase (GGCT)/AIG2-like uncharacterized protein YtfP
MRNHISVIEAPERALPAQRRQLPSNQLVFVYGSLKQGFANHHVLGTAEFVGRGRTLPEFDLIDCGPFPAIISGGRSVTGELYKVDAATMKDLDVLEGNGILYQRKKRPVIVNGQQISAWIYIYLHDDGYLPLVKGRGNRVTWQERSGRL